MQFGKVTADEGFQETEEFVDLGFRPPPVFRREGKQGQKRDPGLTGCLYRLTDRLDPLAVAEGSRQAPCVRPASVAIHDDRYMLRNDAMMNCRHWRGSRRLGEDGERRLCLKPA